MQHIQIDENTNAYNCINIFYPKYIQNVKRVSRTNREGINFCDDTISYEYDTAQMIEDNLDITKNAYLGLKRIETRLLTNGQLKFFINKIDTSK